MENNFDSKVEFSVPELTLYFICRGLTLFWNIPDIATYHVILFYHLMWSYHFDKTDTCKYVGEGGVSWALFWFIYHKMISFNCFAKMCTWTWNIIFCLPIVHILSWKYFFVWSQLMIEIGRSDCSTYPTSGVSWTTLRGKLCHM